MFDSTKSYPADLVNGLVLKTEEEIEAYGDFWEVCGASIYILNGQVLTIMTANFKYLTGHSTVLLTLAYTYKSCVSNFVTETQLFYELSEDERTLRMHSLAYSFNISGMPGPTHSYKQSTINTSFSKSDGAQRAYLNYDIAAKHQNSFGPFGDNRFTQLGSQHVFFTNFGSV